MGPAREPHATLIYRSDFSNSGDDAANGLAADWVMEGIRPLLLASPLPPPSRPLPLHPYDPTSSSLPFDRIPQTPPHHLRHQESSLPVVDSNENGNSFLEAGTVRTLQRWLRPALRGSLYNDGTVSREGKANHRRLHLPCPPWCDIGVVATMGAMMSSLMLIE